MNADKHTQADHGGGSKTVPIFVNKTKYGVENRPYTGREILGIAGYDETFDLFLLQGEGDPTGTQIGLDETVEIKAGLHFRALPGNRNFGHAVVHPDHQRIIDELRDQGLKVSVQFEGNIIGIVIDDYPLPRGMYNNDKTRLLLRAPADPNGALDMFWTSPDLVRVDGRSPTKADMFEVYHGERWRRFSWHRNGTWKPGRDNPLTYLAFVDDGLARAAA